MIYTDGTHIISDAGVQELHWFCERAAIGRMLFDSESNQYKRPWWTTTNKLIEKGARYVTATHMEQMIKEKK